MLPRTIVIGDIHGCSTALAKLLDAISPTNDDIIMTLGDYIDRGIDSRGVIEQLIELQGVCEMFSLTGNHEEMMLNARHSHARHAEWMNYGGIATLDSYGDRGLEDIPEEHWRFIEQCTDWCQTGTHILLHANYEPARRIEEQSAEMLRWQTLDEHMPGPHCSDKIVVVGHTPQRSGEILDRGHLLCIDTAVSDGGVLTAIDIVYGTVWTASEV